MATFKWYGACLFDNCKCQEFDASDLNVKVCELCLHKRGFHSHQDFPTAMQAMVEQKSYCACAIDGCMCQEFDIAEVVPKECDVCEHQRGFHHVVIPSLALHPEPLLEPHMPNESHLRPHMSSLIEESANKKTKTEKEETSAVKDTVVSFPPASCDNVPENVLENAPLRPPHYFVSKLADILKEHADVTENAGIVLACVGGKWRVQCDACQSSISCGPSTSLKNFEEHVATPKHKTKYETLLGRRVAIEREREEQKLLAVEKAARTWVAAHAHEGIVLVGTDSWACTWCALDPAKFTNGTGNIKMHLKGRDHQRQVSTRSIGAAQPGGATVLQMLHSGAASSREQSKEDHHEQEIKKSAAE
eukprot:TRINITY_DN18937_c1_g1_i2.p1 TRINITY_DN18937_c1_g1~~TRINITY_DN18937_c1_g1_i2.p1  ORF type:complete len:361 (+),score=55.91 TRINITY_DN18937_c1_g1_i2:133-1215(+)